MIEIKPTKDLQEINFVLNAPEVKRWICDDFTKNEITQRNLDFLYLKVLINCDLVGLLAGVPRGSIELEAHTAYLKKAWGNTIEPTYLAIDWVFKNTNCEKITGRTPVDNKRALAFNSRLGFKLEGINRKSIYRNGKLIDQLYYGLEKSSWV